VEVDIIDRKAIATSLITFIEALEDFELLIPARIKLVEMSEWMNCEVKVGEATLLKCKLNLTMTKTITFKYETEDFTKSIDHELLFDGDFTLGQHAKTVIVYVRLKEGIVLASEPKIFPTDVVIGSDGRRIMLFWRLKDVGPETPLRFKLLYEPLEAPTFWQLHFILTLTVLAVTIMGFALYWFKRSKYLMLSMLKEDEQKVVDVLLKEKGVARQRKVVRETGMSKAKVSRVVKALAERGMLEVQRIGRTNRLKLKKRFRFL
jgi:uncharacterized membrane protein